MDEATNPCGGTELQDSLPRPLRFTRNKGETVAGVARLRDVATQGPELWRAQLRQLGSIIN